MSFDLTSIMTSITDDLLADAGKPLGLKPETSVKAGRSLVSHWSKGKDAAVAAAAEETGLGQEVVSQLAGKVVEIGKQKAAESAKAAFNEGPVADAMNNAKAQAMGALGGGGGFLGKLFRKK